MGAVRGADGFEFWFFTLAATAIAAGSFWYAFRWVQRARLIEDVPTSRVRSASQGYVELQGRGELMPGEQIRAPLTGLPCLWWSYKIERLEREGLRRERWRAVEQAASDSLFLLADDTGQCVIDPEGAEVLPAAKEVWRGATARPLAGKPRRRFGSGGYRYTERRLHVSEPLYAIGFFDTRANASAWDVNEETRLLIAEWKRQRTVMVERFDANGDGQIDLGEWEQVRRAARREIERARREQATAPGIHVMSRPPDDRPFILAALPQPRLARGYRLRASAAFAAFLLLGGVSTFLLATRLG